jgi:hypothetical protein
VGGAREPGRTAARVARRGPAVSPGLAGGAVAVELERTTKPPGDYARILRWYGGALAYERVAWFAATEALRRRLADLITRERLDDFMAVEPLPPGVWVRAWG